MNTIDDATLVLQFITQGSLVSNQNLRVETAFDSAQLLAKRSGLVATSKVVKGVRTVILRHNSEYKNLVHHVLVENNFMPVGSSARAEFIQYEARTIPAGYKLNCNEARFLWKDWWTGMRDGNPNTIQVEILIYCRGTWYPIREVSCNQGMLFITTLVSELVFQGSEPLIWLTKAPETLESSQSAPPLAEVKLRAKAFLAATRSDSRLFPTQAAIAAQAASEAPATNSARKQPDDADMRPDLRQVIKFKQGKLHITTALGEVVVEGSNLKFWLNDEELSINQKTIDLGSYRDREVRAVNS